MGIKNKRYFLFIIIALITFLLIAGLLFGRYNLLIHLCNKPCKPSTSNMVWIPGGEFVMGSSVSINGETDHPEHKVIIDGFYMDTVEVTQKEYGRVMGKNPSEFKNCPECPVEKVSWYDAEAYCKKVGKRLPTEAEWEYACRAGGKNAPAYDGQATIDDYAWYSDNSGNGTHPVGRKKPNGFGLYDMLGNVWEWCSDWYDSAYYLTSPIRNPQGPDTGEHKVFRGGSWFSGAPVMNCSLRDYGVPHRREGALFGFRCAYSPK